MTKKFDNALLKILACPVCKGELTYDEKAQELICYESKLAFKVKNGVPIMLIDEARKI